MAIYLGQNKIKLPAISKAYLGNVLIYQSIVNPLIIVPDDIGDNSLEDWQGIGTYYNYGKGIASSTQGGFDSLYYARILMPGHPSSGTKFPLIKYVREFKINTSDALIEFNGVSSGGDSFDISASFVYRITNSLPAHVIQFRNNINNAYTLIGEIPYTLGQKIKLIYEQGKIEFLLDGVSKLIFEDSGIVFNQIFSSFQPYGNFNISEIKTTVYFEGYEDYYNLETRAIIERALSLNFYTPKQSTLKAFSNYIDDQKANGTWFSGSDIQNEFTFNDINCADFSRINFKNPAGVLLEIVGGMTYTLNGWKGNGVDGYIKTGYVPSASGNQMTLSSIGIVHGLFNDFTVSAGELMGIESAAPRIRIGTFPNHGSGNIFFSNDISSAIIGTKKETNRIVAFGRDGSTKYININGVHASQNVASLSPFIAGEYFISATNVNGSSNFFCNGTNTHFRSGAKITQAMAAQNKIDRNKYLTAIGLTPIA